MVRSDNFSDVIAMIIHNDKKGVVSFMRSQGINVSATASNNAIIEALGVGFSSSKFRDAFAKWGDSRYSNNVNMGHTEMSASGFDPMSTQSGGFSPLQTQLNASGFDPLSTQSGGFSPMQTQLNASGFDPMSTQGGSGSFDPMTSQEGANLLDDNFANASGFDPMQTQSGGFSPMETQMVNFSDDFDVNDLTKPDYVNDPNKSKLGNFFGKIDFGSIINIGAGIFGREDEYKKRKKLAEANVKVAELELQEQLAKGEITLKQLETQLAIVKEQNKAPQSNVLLYVVGGVVLLGALGTAIYFATRKK